MSGLKLRVMQLIWLLATFGFLIGIYLPLISISKLYFFENSVSILDATTHLIASDKWPVGLVIALFSIAVPLVKIVLLGWLLFGQNTGQAPKQLLHYLHEFGRWSMLDVMVVAVLIVTVKIGALVSVEVHQGLYVFGAAALLLMGLMHFCKPR